MGKKTDLIQARKSCYDDVKDTQHGYHPSIKARTQPILSNEEILTDTAVLIQQRLFDYTVKHALPLCEYLDIENLENYVLYMLNTSGESDDVPTQTDEWDIK